MELWIRSQDKEKLVLTKGFELQNPSYNDGCQIFEVWQNNYHCVGNYKTKVRALEVLDEIQNILKPEVIVKTYNVEQAELLNGTKFIQPMIEDIQVQQASTYVYEMPEE